MKNETKSKIIVIESIIVIVFSAIIIFGLSYQCGSDTEYRKVLDDNRKLGERYAELNTENESANNKIIETESELKEYRDNAEKRIMQLEYINMEKNKAIMALKKERNAIQDSTGKISDATSGIRKILSEIKED